MATQQQISTLQKRQQRLADSGNTKLASSVANRLSQLQSQPIQPPSVPKPTERAVDGNIIKVTTPQGTAESTVAPQFDPGPLPTPRLQPTVPTPQNPVTTFGQPQKTTPLSMDEIALKRYKGEQLTDDEFKFLFNETAKKNEATLANTGYQAQIDLANKQAADAAAKRAEQEKLIMEKEQSARQLGEQRIDTSLNRQVEQARISGQERLGAQQSAFSFSGFGRSTKNAEALDKIGRDTANQLAVLEESRAAQKALLDAQLRGASSEEMGAIGQNIQALQNKAAELETAALGEIARLNQENGVKGVEAMNNLIEGLSQFGKGNKVDKTTSELLGYVADEYGNPVTGGDGKPLSLPNDGVKFEKYTDEYTGQTYFYNPYDPTDVKMAPGNGFQTYTNELGQAASSPTSNTQLMQPLKPAEDLQKFANNCVLYAKNAYCPNIPTGATSVAGRKAGIQEAQKNGYGGTDMNLAQIGDIIHTSEGDVGHTARIIGKKGDKWILEEANYTPGQITSGRELGITDPKILGWIRPNTRVGATPTSISEGNSYSIQEQMQGVQFSPDAVRDFQTYAAKGQLPSFSGTSQLVKDQKEANFRKNYNLWASQNPSSAPQYDLDQVSKLASRYKPLTDDIRTLEQGFAVKKDFNVNTTNPYDDQALIFSFMKVLDPTSVVREGEFNFAQRNASYLESIFAGASQAINGTGLLGKAQRENIIRTMDTLYKKKRAQYDAEMNGAKQVGNTFGIPSNLFLNFDTQYIPQDFNAPAFQNDPNINVDQQINAFSSLLSPQQKAELQAAGLIQ